MSRWVAQASSLDRLSRFTTIRLAELFDDDRVVMYGPDIATEYAAGVDPGPDAPWLLQVRNEALPALYAELGRLLGTFTDTQAVEALRRDYDAERKRVDLFIASLTRGAP